MSQSPAENVEEVLVVPRRLFEELGAFQGMKAASDEAMATLLDPAHAFFMPRPEAEEDPTHKQLIAYALFTDGERFLHYERGASGGESRLHAQGSVGIGGHINPVDLAGGPMGRPTYEAGVAREIQEELHLQGGFTQRVVGLLNDDSNRVGEVHLGVVHLFELDNPAVEAAEDALHNLQWRRPKELHTTLFDSLETWSQLCVKALVPTS